MSARLAQPGSARARAEAPSRGRRLRRVARWAAIALGAAVLALSFASYMSPDMAFTLMTQAWSCL